ncbi:acyltransferase domain-containing protein [Streptomyces sp. NPDC093586]|uniref:acyltransferase domain-containing protein n=1 Tax=Streptomyces sp. NPDC093586 TaxID=3366042 RepID=UPI0037F7ECEC
MLPDIDDLPEVLLDLAVPFEDIDTLISLHRAVTRDPEVTRLLEECVEELVRDLGEVAVPADVEAGGPDSGQVARTGGVPRFAERLAEAPDALGDYFAAFVFVAALPHTRAYHRSRGIPAEVTRRTLADLGRNMAGHRRRHGTGGVQAPRWLAHHFRGELYQLGRLQFERARLGRRTVPLLRQAGLDAVPGEPCLHLHIPGSRGPLTPTACDRSLARAREFFRRHFPEEPYRAATCHSWLLDPQLKRYLAPDSRILLFQERFQVVRDTEPADTEPVRFVFGDPELAVGRLPRRTSVERAVGDHLRAGGHWYIGHGWLPL